MGKRMVTQPADDQSLRLILLPACIDDMQSLAVVLLHAHTVKLPRDNADGRCACLLAVGDVRFKLHGRPG